MRCPYCDQPLAADAAECPSCRLTYPRTSALLGAMPRLTPIVSDTTGSLLPAEASKLRRRIEEIQRNLPQLVLQVVIHHFPAEHPFSMHVFWLFNAGAFAGDGRRGKDSHVMLLVLDPARCESALMPGYGLEPLLKREALDHLLELAGPYWDNRQWADGIHRVLTGLEQLLHSVSVPDDSAVLPKGEY